MGEPPPLDKAKEAFVTEQWGWHVQGGRLRPVPTLAFYIGAICLFGLAGILPISRNMVLSPDGAGDIAPLLHILALVHSILGAIVWRRWLRVELAKTGALQKTVSTLALFVLIYAVCAFAFLRGAPFVSTYLWGVPQQLEVHIDNVRPTKSRGMCSNRLFLGVGRRAYRITLKDFGWPNQVLCVDGYDGPLIPSGAKFINAVPILMNGQGNWLAFRMEQYEVQ